MDNNINTLKKLSKLGNVNLYILSICIYEQQIEDKNNWLDKHAPYFEKEKRIIIPKESYPNISSKELKYNTLKKYKGKLNNIIVIDDDNGILKYLSENLKEIDYYQDSSIVD